RGARGGAAPATAGMRRLNRDAAAALRAAGAATHAVTDVTGYGLAGHAWEVAERSGATLRLDGPVLPAYPGVRAAAARGVRTGGDPRNRAYVAGRRPGTRPDDATNALAPAPQTSGGLLAAVPPAAVEDLRAAAGFVPIGRVAAGPAGVVLG